MPVKNVGDNLWDIDVAIKVNGKQLRRLRRNWKGSERAAQNLHNEFLLELQGIAGQQKTISNDSSTVEYSSFSQVVEAYVTVRKPFDICSYNRIAEETKNVPVNSKAVKTFAYGGIDENGNQVQSYFKRLETTNVRKFHGSNKNGTVVTIDRFLGANVKNKLYRALKATCIWAVEQEILPSNPINIVCKWKELPRNRTLSDAELDILMEVMKTQYSHYLPIFLHSIRNPSRISDLRKLTKTNLNLTNKTIHFITSKKKVPVTQFIYPELEDYFNSLPENCPYLFYVPVEKDGVTEYLPVGDFKKSWHRALHLSNIKNLRWHDLRHHALTWLMTKMNLRTHHCMNIGGWSSRQIIETYHNADHQATIQEAQELLNLTKKPKRRKKKS